ncbi:MAG: DUF4157 domain-containing protein [Filimonas sp.]|nr:DUF4157 domain-containing protein [Filimonas sp.]
MPTLKIKIRENALIARIAAWRMRTVCVAVVVGKTIYLWNITRNDFLGNEAWVKHEVAHVHQYSKLGIARFLFLYLIESAKKGYLHNRFEIEARERETEVTLLDGIVFT